MKTLLAVLGALAIGAAWAIESYITTDCQQQEIYVKQIPTGQMTYILLKQGKCYLIE